MPGPVVARLIAAVLLTTIAVAQEPDGDESSEPHTGSWFVYRHPSEAGWGKRVVRLPDASVLEFFQRTWREAPRDETLHEWLRQQLGGDVYGLAALYRAVAEEGVPAPKSLGELQVYLDRHLWVEGDPIEQIRVGEHSVRVRTDDDDHELAYHFFDAAALRAHPEHLAFLVHDDPKLPAGAATNSTITAPTDVPRLLPSADGEGFTVAICAPVLETATLSGLEQHPAVRIVDGVRVADLADHLRGVQPDGDEPWPMPWLALRAVLGAQDETVTGLRTLQGLRNDLVFTFGGPPMEGIDLTGEHAAVHAATTAALADAANAGEEASGEVDSGAHHAVAFLGGDTGPMILFDDLWASAHPELAHSLIGWARGWDPLDAVHTEQLGQAIAVREHVPGQLVGQRTAELTIDCPAPDVVCLDGDRLWLATGRALRTLDLESGRLAEPVELPFQIAGIAVLDAVPHLLAAERDRQGRWVIMRLDADGRTTEAVLAVPGIEFAGIAVEALGLAARDGRLFVHQTAAILELDGAGSRVRIIGTVVGGLRGLSAMDDALVTHLENHLLGIHVTPRRATARWIPLGAAPLAAAADDTGFVTVWPGQAAGQCSIRRFRREAQHAHRIEVVFVPKPGEDPEAESPALESIHWTLDGVRFDDLASLSEKLRSLVEPPADWPGDTLGAPVPPSLRVAVVGPVWASEGDEIDATMRAAQSAGFDDVEFADDSW